MNTRCSTIRILVNYIFGSVYRQWSGYLYWFSSEAVGVDRPLAGGSWRSQAAGAGKLGRSAEGPNRPYTSRYSLAKGHTCANWTHLPVDRGYSRHYANIARERRRAIILRDTIILSLYYHSIHELANEVSISWKRLLNYLVLPAYGIESFVSHKNYHLGFSTDLFLSSGLGEVRISQLFNSDFGLQNLRSPEQNNVKEICLLNKRFYPYVSVCVRVSVRHTYITHF